MNSKVVVRLMENLIGKKFYQNKEDVYGKLDVYYALNRISEEEYAELALMTEEVYAEPIPEPETHQETEE